MSLNKEYSQMVKEQSASLPFLHPLICGTEFRSSFPEKSRWMQEYHHLQQLACHRQWQNFPELLEPLHDPATALIVTDASETIHWVNQGFSRMTGYSSQEVSGRTPRFLQGEKTDREEKLKVRQQLNRGKPYEGILLNYRKSGESYLCSISVLPLFNRKQELVNFLAVEKECFPAPVI